MKKYRLKNKERSVKSKKERKNIKMKDQWEIKRKKYREVTCIKRYKKTESRERERESNLMGRAEKKNKPQGK